eukprot:6084909-Amphidinium_carterae.2
MNVVWNCVLRSSKLVRRSWLLKAAYDRIAKRFNAHRRYPWEFVLEWLQSAPEECLTVPSVAIYDAVLQTLRQ